jgi:hypothetical protein
MKAAPIEF